MNIEQTPQLRRRAALHAALSDPARLAIVDFLTVSDASPSELATQLRVPSNLLAHHLNVLETEGLITRTRSEGDRRRIYVHLQPDALASLAAHGHRAARRVLFVCTANSARSVLATALWKRASVVPAASAGTHPARHINPGAVTAAERHGLPLRRARPRHLGEIHHDGDLVITVCDNAYEELGDVADLHWSVPDPVLVGTARAFDAAFDELAHRIATVAPHITPR